MANRDRRLTVPVFCWQGTFSLRLRLSNCNSDVILRRMGNLVEENTRYDSSSSHAGQWGVANGR